MLNLGRFAALRDFGIDKTAAVHHLTSAIPHQTRVPNIRGTRLPGDTTNAIFSRMREVARRKLTRAPGIRDKLVEAIDAAEKVAPRGYVAHVIPGQGGTSLADITKQHKGMWTYGDLNPATAGHEAAHLGEFSRHGGRVFKTYADPDLEALNTLRYETKATQDALQKIPIDTDILSAASSYQYPMLSLPKQIRGDSIDPKFPPTKAEMTGGKVKRVLDYRDKELRAAASKNNPELFSRFNSEAARLEKLDALQKQRFQEFLSGKLSKPNYKRTKQLIKKLRRDIKARNSQTHNDYLAATNTVIHPELLDQISPRARRIEEALENRSARQLEADFGEGAGTKVLADMATLRDRFRSGVNWYGGNGLVYGPEFVTQKIR